MLVERFGFPWQHVAPRHLTHFYSVFTADETVPLGTWQATPFEVTAMLEKGFRGSPLTPDQLILTWNGKPLASGVILPSPGLSQTLCKALRGAVAVTAPQAGSWRRKLGPRTAGAMPGLPVFCSQLSRATRQLSIRASRSWSGPDTMTTDRRGCMVGMYMALSWAVSSRRSRASGLTGSAPRKVLKSCAPRGGLAAVTCAAVRPGYSRAASRRRCARRVAEPCYD
jgi:hypothetical protein